MCFVETKQCSAFILRLQSFQCFGFAQVEFFAKHVNDKLGKNLFSQNVFVVSSVVLIALIFDLLAHIGNLRLGENIWGSNQHRIIDLASSRGVAVSVKAFDVRHEVNDHSDRNEEEKTKFLIVCRHTYQNWSSDEQERNVDLQFWTKCSAKMTN